MEAAPVVTESAVTVFTLILSANPILALLVAESISTVTLVSALLKPNVPPCLIFAVLPLSSVKLIPFAISAAFLAILVVFWLTFVLVACN